MTQSKGNRYALLLPTFLTLGFQQDLRTYLLHMLLIQDICTHSLTQFSFHSRKRRISSLYAAITGKCIPKLCRLHTKAFSEPVHRGSLFVKTTMPPGYVEIRISLTIYHPLHSLLKVLLLLVLHSRPTGTVILPYHHTFMTFPAPPQSPSLHCSALIDSLRIQISSPHQAITSHSLLFLLFPLYIFPDI